MNQRIMLTKRLLKESLMKLLQGKNIYQISVKELCGTAGINRSTFYAHYGSPADVLLEVEREVADDIMGLTPQEGVTQKERLLCICTYLYEHADTEKILFRNNSDADIAKVLGDAAFAVWRPETYFGADICENATDRKLVSVFVNYGMYNVIKKWLLEEPDKKPEEIAELICKIMKI